MNIEKQKYKISNSFHAEIAHRINEKRLSYTKWSIYSIWHATIRKWIKNSSKRWTRRRRWKRKEMKNMKDWILRKIVIASSQLSFETLSIRSSLGIFSIKLRVRIFFYFCYKPFVCLPSSSSRAQSMYIKKKLET